MSSYYEAYYGSGLKLNQMEFNEFVERYLEVTGQSKKDIVAKVWDYSELDYEIDIESEFDDMVRSDEVLFIYGSDLSVMDQTKHFFQVVYVSPDNCDGMCFQPYYSNGKMNVYFDNEKEQIKNTDYVEPISNRHEISYMFYSDHELDSPHAFKRKPYDSYEEFKQEFKDKMAAYLPDDFDWDAHIGRFNYACYG